MFKKILVIFVATLLIIVGIIAFHSHKPNIIGTWKSDATILGLSEQQNTEVILIFNSDGTALFKNPSVGGETVNTEFKYTIKDNTLSVLSVNNAKPQTTDNIYEYDIKQDILTIYFREQELTFQKVK